MLELHLLFCSDVSSLLKGNTVFDAMRMRESIPRQIDKKFRVPKEEKGVWASGGGDGSPEIGDRSSQGGGKDNFFFPYIDLS